MLKSKKKKKERLKGNYPGSVLNWQPGKTGRQEKKCGNNLNLVLECILKLLSAGMDFKHTPGNWL